MQDSRAELGLMFAGALLLAGCGTILFWAGAAGRISPEACLFFMFVAVGGTALAIFEIREVMHARRYARAAAARRHQATSVVGLRTPIDHVTWGERIQGTRAATAAKRPAPARTRTR